jgi:hypothetical protein
MTQARPSRAAAAGIQLHAASRFGTFGNKPIRMGSVYSCLDVSRVSWRIQRLFMSNAA